MAEQPVVIQKISWGDLCPWTIMFRTLPIAASFSVLAFALLGRGTGMGLRDLLPALLCAVGIMGLVIVVTLGLEPLRPLQGVPRDLSGLGPALCLLLSLAVLPGLRAAIMRRVRAR